MTAPCRFQSPLRELSSDQPGQRELDIDQSIAIETVK
jgi:hypothetical protein